MVEALQRQLAYLEGASAFYAERLRGAREQVRGPEDLRRLPLTTKDELREGQRREPPFGPHLCAPPERLVRMHVTSGTTGDPVAVGFTRNDHEANSAVGGEAFRIAGVRTDDVVAHCLNYALYAGGVADHMAMEASGATVVPVGTGQSRRLLELIPWLGITAIFGTLSFPAYLAARAREAGLDPLELGVRLIVTAGEPGAGVAAVRAEIERTWGASVADTFGMSDVWSTMAGACGQGEGLHLTVSNHAVLELVEPDSGAPVELEDGASGELVWTHLRREASPLLRYRSGDLARVWTAPCACGRRSPRIRIDGRLDDMLRVQAVNVYPQAIGAVLAADAQLGRHCVVAEGDPVRPPLELYVEAPAELDVEALAERLRGALGARFAVTRLEPGSLPAAEHKTRIVHRTARGDALPAAVESLRRAPAR
ncbi:MAG TPA: AMP-binding protein [Thermoleophilaceae bacterium]|nr:AMP-binding protein [Thermoleophilaceae bacterium]